MWISVNDFMPEPNQVVDIWRRGHGRITNCVASYRWNPHDPEQETVAYWLRADTGKYQGGASVTHWMPLPDPPKGQTHATRT
jgi:hypothetical protein